jgi:hypothetical protein
MPTATRCPPGTGRPGRSGPIPAWLTWPGSPAPGRCWPPSARPPTAPKAARPPLPPTPTGRWLFSHNGRLDGWPQATAALAAGLPPADLLALEARCDSALAWALVAARLRAGEPAATALAGVIADLRGHGVTGRFNFLLTDGEAITATAAGDTLCYRVSGPAVEVASEPGDYGPGWADVPGNSVLTAAPGAVEVRPLPPMAAATPRERISPR